MKLNFFTVTFTYEWKASLDDPHVWMFFDYLVGIVNQHDFGENRIIHWYAPKLMTA